MQKPIDPAALRPSTLCQLPFPSSLSTVASCLNIIADEWPVLISLRLWETEPLRCDKGFMWC